MARCRFSTGSPAQASAMTSVSSDRSEGVSGRVAATPTRRALTSKRDTGAKAGLPERTPCNSASQPWPYALATAIEVIATDSATGEHLVQHRQRTIHSGHFG